MTDMTHKVEDSGATAGHNMGVENCNKSSHPIKTILLFI